MFYSLPNLTSIVVSEMPEPWEAYKQTVMPAALKEGQNKTAYRTWCGNPATQHAFISGVEAMDPGRRVSWDEGNPALKLHHLIVDYDASTNLDETELERLRSGARKWPSEFAPSYVADSFTNGHLRVVWLFAKPVLIASQKHYTKFMQILDKKVKFNKWFSGFEPEALGDAAKYYMIGDNYRPVKPTAVLPANLLDLWSYEAAQMVQDTLVERVYNIPLDAVAKEVATKFPGRWSGPFQVGARGLRFWDPTASDPSGAVVLDHGMLAYSGEQAFIPWVKILGTSFVEKFEADRITSVLDRVVLEQKSGSASSSYWVLNKNKWVCFTLGQTKMWLECQGFSDKPRKDSSATEITKVLNEVHLNRCVEGALPYVMYPHGIIQVDGRRILNTSDKCVVPPAPKGTCITLAEGRTYFPRTWAFLSGFFEKVAKDPRSESIQLECFLSWLQHAYTLYYKQTPQPGLILAVVGPQSAGKSFLLRKIIARMLGGCHDLGDILSSKGTNYTDLMAQSPVAYVDDMSEVTTTEEHKKYSERIKALVSNHQVTYNGKWKSTGDTLWYGRIVLCMNNDASGVRMLPDLGLSMAGKVAMLMADRNRSDGYQFNPDWNAEEVIINKELPYFCRWLMDSWRTPDYLENQSQPRYHVVPYKHPELYMEAQERGSKHELFEIVDEFMKDEVKLHSGDKTPYEGWKGSTTVLYGVLSGGPFANILKKWTPGRLGTALGLLATATNIKRVRGSHNITNWLIPPDFGYVEQEEFGEKIHTKADQKKKEEQDEADSKKRVAAPSSAGTGLENLSAALGAG